MTKMADLHAQGVTNLYDYNEGVASERARISAILQDAEWHEESKSFTQTDTDLSHDPTYCWGCQLLEQVNK